jgi:hypothetical protein
MGKWRRDRTAAGADRGFWLWFALLVVRAQARVPVPLEAGLCAGVKIADAHGPIDVGDWKEDFKFKISD